MFHNRFGRWTLALGLCFLYCVEELRIQSSKPKDQRPKTCQTINDYELRTINKRRMNPGSNIADVVIIGGGVIGLAVARALALRGVRDVLLIERNSLGAESSSAAAGMLAQQAEANRPHEFFYLTCQSRDLYPGFASSLLEETGIDIELEPTGTLYLAFTDHDADELDQRYDWQKHAELPIEKLSGDEARELEPAICDSVRAALRFPLDTQVENRRLISALAVANERLGVRIETGTEVALLKVERGRVTGIETSRGFIATEQV